MIVLRDFRPSHGIDLRPRDLRPRVQPFRKLPPLRPPPSSLPSTRPPPTRLPPLCPIPARPCHDGKPVYNCEHCNYSSVSKQNLGRHVRIHTGERPYKCAECGFTAARKWTLVTHLRNHHKDNSPCPCTEWDYAAGIPYRISHNGNCPYKCKKCGFIARQLSDLHLHQQTHMKVQRIYNCDKCDYVTAKKSNMADHLRTHSGERPYKCAECGYAAARKWTLASHFKANHTNKLAQVSASE